MGVYMEFSVNGVLRRYNVSSASGSLVNFNTTFTTAQNTDGFFTTTSLTETVIDAALVPEGSWLESVCARFQSCSARLQPRL